MYLVVLYIQTVTTRPRSILQIASVSDFDASLDSYLDVTTVVFIRAAAHKGTVYLTVKSIAGVKQLRRA